MALPEELLDELLSAHLDDALSGDELARVERLLSEDPAIEQRFENLRRQRQEFREAAFATPKLPDGFADKIVQAAIDQAQAEGLSADHPLQLAAQDSRVSRASAGTFSGPRLVAMVVGLAASALFVGFLVKKYTGDPTNQQIANAPIEQPIENPTGTAPLDTAIVVTDPPRPGRTEIEPLVSSGPDTAIVSSDNDDQSTDPSPMTPEPSLPLLADAGDSVSPRLVNDGPPSQSVAEVAVAPRPLNMLMVVEINQSEAGRSIGAFDQALVDAQIEVGEERLVDEKLARVAAKKANTKSLVGQSDQVILLESPAKKLDLLVVRLVSDRDNFTSIRFSAISAELDAPLLGSIESVRTMNPTKIRHEGHGFPIGGRSAEVFNGWTSELVDREFAPLESELDAKAVSTIASSNGPDQMANILFLIRSEND